MVTPEALEQARMAAERSRIEQWEVGRAIRAAHRLAERIRRADPQAWERRHTAAVLRIGWLVREIEAATAQRLHLKRALRHAEVNTYDARLRVKELGALGRGQENARAWLLEMQQEEAAARIPTRAAAQTWAVLQKAYRAAVNNHRALGGADPTFTHGPGRQPPPITPDHSWRRAWRIKPEPEPLPPPKPKLMTGEQRVATTVSAMEAVIERKIAAKARAEACG